MTEFTINNAVHASPGHTPLFVNTMQHPLLLSTLGAVAFSLCRRRYMVALAQPQNTADTHLSAAIIRARARARIRQGDVLVPGTDTVKSNERAKPTSSKDNVSGRAQKQRRLMHRPVVQVSDVLMTGIDTEKPHAQSGTDANRSGGSGQGTDADIVSELDPGFTSQVTDFVQERQAIKFNADIVGMGNTNEFKVGLLVLLAAQNLRTHAVSGFGASKLAPRFIAPFMVAERHGTAYTLELPSDMRLHPTFYVGRSNPYVQPESSSRDTSPQATRGATSASRQAFSPSPEKGELVPTSQHGCLR
ncbi:hypothetical protein PHMEG_0007243 [Phytophthora megakarya]|uniref:Tf2-1-like SH3-like domain-containing protein n=1 Tax=Phytophthora megakarya TaxID=4795 RepID=A0A225WLU0_9STRA|nr:hypothetical protein PHMEG_0007243 [Phytophthora megakarya]